MTATQAITATACAVCARPLTDAESLAAGIGPDCRAMHGYTLNIVPVHQHAEVNRLVHAIAADALYGSALREAIFKLHSFGFEALAKRIERRVWRRMVPQQTEIVMSAPVQPPALGKIDLPFTLTEGQERARTLVQKLKQQRGHALGFVVGFAGTGKTTVLKVFAQEHGRPQIITPTGRAALRVREATGLQASTIHRWLYKPKENDKTGAVSFVRREAQDIEVPPSRLVLLDEASMVGPDVWKDVLTVCQQMDLKLVCVGDGFQLMPVQPPNMPPFSILTPEFALQLGAERVEMTEVLRQAQDSPVIRASMALRNGGGLGSLRDLQPVSAEQLAGVATATHRNGGITICHRNVTRFQLNAGLRMMLGIPDELPQIGEPLVVLKNNYEAGLMNGEAITFGGWDLAPGEFERVFDRYKNLEEAARFGATTIGDVDRVQIVLALEEMHGRLGSGPRAISIAANRWARINNLYSGGSLASHAHANYGYAWTAHKCVHPDTLVETSHGLQRIRDIEPEGFIATAQGKRPYRALVANPAGKMLRVRTKDGYTVDVTPDHGVFVWNGDDYVRVEARNIQPGAFVRLKLRQQFVTPIKAPSLPRAPDTDVRAIRYSFPAVLTEEVSELLGLLVADGTVTERGVIRLTKRHVEVTKRFAQLCSSVFGFTPPITPNYNGTRAYCVEANSKQIADWLRAVGGTEPNNKFVPDVILRSPLNFQAKFLRGLFEDGTVNEKRGVMDHIEWSNCTESVVATVQTMLLRFGIIAGRRTRTKGEHAQTMLYIYGENARHFGMAIGFVSTLKVERVALPTGRQTRYKAPFSRQERTAVWPHLRKSEKNNLRARGTMSRDCMHIVLARDLSAEAHNILESKLEWHHAGVATVESIEDAPSMCVEVPLCSRFLQNGFDGSNSQGSEWPYVLVCIEPSVRMDQPDGPRWIYTSITRAQKQAAVYIGKV